MHISHVCISSVCICIYVRIKPSTSSLASGEAAAGKSIVFYDVRKYWGEGKTSQCLLLYEELSGCQQL